MTDEEDRGQYIAFMHGTKKFAEVPGEIMAMGVCGDRILVCSTEGPFFVDNDGNVEKVCPSKVEFNK